jgi:hypothetical protein
MRRRAEERQAEIKQEARAQVEPGQQMTAAGKAAEAIARAAGQLVEPLQTEIRRLNEELGEVREGLRRSRERERQCQANLAHMHDWAVEASRQLNVPAPVTPQPVPPENP